jgi:hypothetical protein
MVQHCGNNGGGSSNSSGSGSGGCEAGILGSPYAAGRDLRESVVHLFELFEVKVGRKESLDCMYKLIG